MAKIYVDLILNDLRKYPEISSLIKNDVDTILKEYVVENKITPEKYKKITGKDYVK